MVEMVLYQVNGAKIEGHSKSATRLGEPLTQSELAAAIFNAIPEEGMTPEEMFELVRIQAEWHQYELAPHQFLLSLARLLEGGFISASTRAVGRS